ncbi:nuclear transport factor 2 family protein [Streptomyces beijiangensis]|uniref:Nuclear transport factor 2 family protein n=1 Tax=Streptomyces beijiangensis TaxID=163361 RepID=A0A939JFG6_9ACTN|nr:nuclear transport factor 2 family protein [Streptomyces beijiangensis]MBO0510497.1 nuclear transport factor 2 family protein [Streptomyces beijiangensis]
MTVELLGTAEPALPSRGFAALYAQAQRFYEHQMRLLDTHDTEAWADTFTEDAFLELPFLPQPLRARAGLARYGRAGAARQRRAGVPLSHWVGLLDVQPQEDGALHTRCSALVYAPACEGGARVLYVCVMEDVLVRAGGEWRIAHRRVTRDDLL